MNEELKFQKLSEVELVEEASENAHPLIEEGGKIKRAKGGLGGGIPMFDLTPYIAEDFSNVTMEENIPIISIAPVFTEQEVEDFINLARSAGAICLQVDLSNYLGMSSASMILNQIYSVQYANITEGDVRLNGVMLFTSIVEMILGNLQDITSMVGLIEGVPQVRICFPLGMGLVVD